MNLMRCYLKIWTCGCWSGGEVFKINQSFELPESTDMVLRLFGYLVSYKSYDDWL